MFSSIDVVFTELDTNQSVKVFFKRKKPWPNLFTLDTLVSNFVNAYNLARHHNHWLHARNLSEALETNGAPTKLINIILKFMNYHATLHRLNLYVLCKLTQSYRYGTNSVELNYDHATQNDKNKSNVTLKYIKLPPPSKRGSQEPKTYAGTINLATGEIRAA